MGTDAYTIEITYDRHGEDPANGDRLLDALLERAAEACPVVGQDTEAGTIDVTLAVDGDDAQRVVSWAVDEIDAAMVAAGLRDARPIVVHCARAGERIAA